MVKLNRKTKRIVDKQFFQYFQLLHYIALLLLYLKSQPQHKLSWKPNFKMVKRISKGEKGKCCKFQWKIQVTMNLSLGCPSESHSSSEENTVCWTDTMAPKLQSTFEILTHLHVRKSHYSANKVFFAENQHRKQALSQKNSI